ncbi:hypothetical protein IGI04_016864 [Brassica rapa subsp. trilocularis]|uniref:Uncharacterized protein n=1 Tax=Brassica rapa subsp. trilocularis TaxID=1813537 RepID=A0ABQ7MU73_BRACM|nr:hypothetical protein IGI04_016864 [Brassica rapa subsp. trilocularis]
MIWSCMGFQRYPHEDQPQGIKDTRLRLFSSDGRSHQIDIITWHIFYTSTLRQSNAYQSYHQQASNSRKKSMLCVRGTLVLCSQLCRHLVAPLVATRRD